MKTNSLSVKLFLPLLMMLSSLLTVGQQTNILPSDTALKEVKTIKVSEISIKSGEVWTQTGRLYETLLSDKEIEKMEVKNDSLIEYLNGLLKTDMALDLKTKNIRYLNNKKVYWKKFADVLDDEKTSLASDIKILNNYKHDFEDEILVWKNTKTIIEKEETEPTIVHRVVELISRLDGVVEQLQQKNDKLLAMLDRTTEKYVILNEYIDMVDKVRLNKKSEIFAQNQPSVFSINYTGKNNWKFKEPLLLFYQMEVIELGIYLKDSIPNIVFQLFLIVILIIAFKMIKKRILEAKFNENSFYLQMLVKIFSQSISAALILGIFASILIFPNRPELFKNIVVFIVTIPLIIITKTYVDRKFFRYLYLFGIIIYLQLAHIIFPAANLFSLFNMVTVILIEMIALWSLGNYFYRHQLSGKFLNNIIIVLIIIHFGFALTGFIGALSGATMLAEITLNFTIANVLSGILVITTAIIINGLIDVGIESSYFRKFNVIRLYGNYLKKKAINIINFFAVIFWLFTIMNVINIKRPIVDAVISFFTNEINIGSTSFSLWNIVIFFLVIWLSILISKMIRILLEQDVLNKLSLAKGVPHTIAMMVRYSIITIGVLLAISAAGMRIDNLTVLLGAFGVGIGFGLQNIFNNIVSGFILLFERPIQIGDTIEVGELIGSVKSIGIRSSNVRTFDGAEVIVPNGQLISNEVVNWTLSDQRRRIEIIAGVAYGSDPHKVKELLLKVLEEHPDVISDPAPYVYFNALGESSLDFRLLFWTSYSGEWIRIRSEVMFKIHDILQEEGISIPFPQMDLHLRSVDKGIEIINKIKQ